MAKSLVEVIEEQGLSLTDSSNGRKVMHCVFHEGDHKASLTIYPPESDASAWTYFCFACGAWGDAVKFLVEYKEWTAKEALEYVGEDYKAPSRKKSGVIKIQNAQVTWKFLNEVAESYHEYLLKSQGPVNYLYSRGLTDETIKKYKLGYTDGAVLKLFYSWEYEIAANMGIITKNGYELLSHRITIPNFLEPGYCDFIVGRTVINDNPKYLNSHGPKPLLGFYEIRNSPIIFVVEGQMDYLTLRQWGLPTVIMGGSRLSKQQRFLLTGKKIVIVPDLEPSGLGMNAAHALMDAFKPNAVILDYSDLNPNPNEKVDINTLATIPGAEEAFKDIVRDEVEWITSLSTRQLEKFFPSLSSTMLLPTT